MSSARADAPSRPGLRRSSRRQVWHIRALLLTAGALTALDDDELAVGLAHEQGRRAATRSRSVRPTSSRTPSTTAPAELSDPGASTDTGPRLGSLRAAELSQVGARGDGQAPAVGLENSH